MILRQSLQEAFQHVNWFVVAIDSENKVLFTNLFFQQKTSWKLEDLQGRNFFDIFDSEWAEKTTFRLDPSLKHLEGIITGKNNKGFSINFNALVFENKEGTYWAILVGGDTTEKRHFSKVLDKSNDLLQNVFDNSHDLIQIVALDGKFIFVNEAWKTATGYSNEDLENLNFEKILHKNSKEQTLNQLAQLNAVGSLAQFETALLSKQGKKINLTGSVSFEYDETGVPMALRAILYDATEQVRAERIQELYFRIADLVLKELDLKKLYEGFYTELKRVLHFDSFLIVLKNEKTQMPDYQYVVNSSKTPAKRISGEIFAEFALTYCENPMFLERSEIANLLKKTETKLPKAWIGVPIRIQNQNLGLIVVQSFEADQRLSENDLSLVSFISNVLITAIERHRHLEKISNQAAHLQALFDSSFLNMWTINRDLEIMEFNRNFVKTMQELYQVTPYRGMKISQIPILSHAANYEKLRQTYKSVFEGNIEHLEMTVFDAQNRKLWRESFINPILKDNSPITEVLGVSHDITEKKLAEISLAQSEAKFRSIFESFIDIYFQCKLDGTILMISPSVEEFIGIEAEKLVEKKIWQKGNKFQWKEIIEILLEKKYLRNYESTVEHTNGEIRTVLSNFKLIYNADNQAVAVECVARDITELRKATEELRHAKDIAERSLEAKKVFLSNMSHEIRTPLNGIIGMIEMLESAVLNAEQKMYVSNLQKSADILLNILNDVLDLSKIEAGKMVLRRQPVLLKEVLEKIKNTFAPKSHAKRLAFQYYIEDDVPPYVLLDEARILQILSNLTSNAIKFTEEGAVRIFVSKEGESNQKMILKVDVIDSGIGISEDNIAQLFVKFNQLDNSYTKSYAGTGLGLAISHELCRLMNGQIGVISEVGEGSCFWFTFETEAVSSEALKIIQERPKTEVTKITNEPFVLIVDDNAINLKVAEGILRKAGCKTETVQSGLEALEKVKRKNYDLILMDIQMPVMNGIDTTLKIKVLNLQPSPPIIALTAYSLPEEREIFLQAGMDDYLSKPIKAQILIEKVAIWTNKGNLEEKGSQNLSLKTQEVENEIISPEVLSQLQKYSDSEILLSFYMDFVNESAELIADCKKALKRRNFDKMREVLHSLKGSAATLGIQQLSAQASKMEADLRQNVVEDLETDSKQLENCFVLFKDNYAKLIEDFLRK